MMGNLPFQTGFIYWNTTVFTCHFHPLVLLPVLYTRNQIPLFLRTSDHCLKSSLLHSGSPLCLHPFLLWHKFICNMEPNVKPSVLASDVSREDCEQDLLPWMLCFYSGSWKLLCCMYICMYVCIHLFIHSAATLHLFQRKIVVY